MEDRFMSSFAIKVDPREAQYARLVFRVLATLRNAVDRRVDEGLTKSAIAERMGKDKSALSRILNGRTRNITLKTVSDILWAVDHEPIEFDADPLELLSPNHVPDHLCGTAIAGTAHVRVQMLAGSFGLTKPEQQHKIELVCE
jgi:transcriptional regulator with XRE-family HTH domain